MVSNDLKFEDFFLKLQNRKSVGGSVVWSRLQEYRQFLQQFNRHFNLYSRSSGFSLDILFFDSFVGAKALNKVFKSSVPVLDIGSGNGFPGMVCALLYPEIPFIFCDRSLKKTEFLKHCVFQLNCSNVKVICQEAELLSEKFKRVLSKGTASTRSVLKILGEILDPQGQAFLWKNSHWRAQWPEKVSFIPEVFKVYEVQAGEKRVLLKVQKERCP